MATSTVGSELNRKDRGFTLFEILVVLVIFTLILTIVPPFLPNVIASSQTKTATRELTANLKKTRSMAITQQKEYALSVDVEKKIFSVDNKPEKLNLPDESRVTIITARSEQESDNKGQIRFFPDGSSTGGQIKIGYKSKEYIIDVNWLTGIVKILPASS